MPLLGKSGRNLLYGNRSILDDLSETLLNIFWNIPTEDFEKFYILLWSIWSDRKHVLHVGATRSGDSLAAFANSFLDEYHAASGCLEIKPVPILGGIPKWKPHFPSLIKLNSDASI
ncbi:hypothetical protein TorRG33x02_193150 [Trema orientale]|uniref:Uncharacterized protein n=1 Tax=Trema orientale TaxID=63057 RepID=A0A2P5EH95_TREOI|nr:hypothetical protein TorRG33x02_193150 [Trema orientale]